MSPLAVLRHRRAAAAAEDTQALNVALRVAADEQRCLAQRFINAGRRDLAQPYIEEAEMWEGAVELVPGS